MAIKIFADGADLDEMLENNDNPAVSGLTTNPTLLRKAGVEDYEAFAKTVLSYINEKPVSFEVFADDLDEMERQARKIASWGDNVFVKIPITNTKGETTKKVIERLSEDGVKINVTAVMTLHQIATASNALWDRVPGIISVFAGRIADTQVDPLPIMTSAVQYIRPFKNQELLWASPREILNLAQAERIGVHIITMTSDLIKKMSLRYKNLTEYSLDTVKMFYDDAKTSGYTL